MLRRISTPRERILSLERPTSGSGSGTTLEELATGAYLRFLERELAAYLSLASLNSHFWNGAKDAILRCLKQHLDRLSAELRNKLMMAVVASRRFPTERWTNSYLFNDQTDCHDDDELFGGGGGSDELSSRDVDDLKRLGRKCCSVCCTGGFLKEVVLGLLVNADLQVFEFVDVNDDDRFRSLFKNRPLGDEMFFDINHVLHQYVRSLSGDQAGQPALKAFNLTGTNYGSVDVQEARSKWFSMFNETRSYLDMSFTDPSVKTPSDCTMLLLCQLLECGKTFENLTTVVFNGEALTSTCSRAWRGNDPQGVFFADRIMSGLGRSAPNLVNLDLSEVSQLTPECLLHLIFKDAFKILHEFMYLSVDDDGASKHPQPCRWCCSGNDNDLEPAIYIMDDRLYERIEMHEPSRRLLLTNCIKSSRLVTSVRAGGGGGETTRICDSLTELKLPPGDSKALVMPLLLCAIPNLTSLGSRVNVYDGMRLMGDVAAFEPHKPEALKLKEFSVELIDASFAAVRSSVCASLRSACVGNRHVRDFVNEDAGGNLNLSEWIEDTLVTADDRQVAWTNQIKEVVDVCPDLESLTVSVPAVRTSECTAVGWEQLDRLARLESVAVDGGSWSFAVRMLRTVGGKLKKTRVRLSSVAGSDHGFIDVILNLCPDLERLSVGCDDDGDDGTASWQLLHGCDADAEWSKLKEVAVTGNLTVDALESLVKRSSRLRSVVVRDGNVVIAQQDQSVRFQKITFTKDRVERTFGACASRCLNELHVAMTFASIDAAKQFLHLMPASAKKLSQLKIQVSVSSLPEDGNTIGDQVTSILRQMVAFKLECKKRQVERGCTVGWSWSFGAILNVLLQQNIMSNVFELIEP